MIPPSQQSGDRHQYPVRHQPPPPSLVGRPIHFTAGQFAGKTIRAELQELQAAAFGRKYAKVDRRPLDPPPVAWLRLFEVLDVGTEAQQEVEVNYDSMHIMGLMCTVDLIPVSGQGHESPPQSPATPSSAAHTAYSSSPPHSPNGVYAYGSPVSPSGYPMSRPLGSMHHVHYGSPGPGSQKVTTALAGTTFVQADSIPWNGRTSLLFTFADLAVKTEGYFILQYRFFDLFSRPTGHTDQPIQADCCGASFRIYSSKEVPPLGKSTELTKHLARYGVRVNVRETERKRKRRERAPSVSPPYTTRAVDDIDRIPSEASDGEDD
ncbi:velvet factor-domain-containing protein [Mycena maculata]|uniref:Velvet factor-domain-containing protein n=1 Tax=Mycena maculata TaxID=230809 RepID=A0AAD7K6S5_9AGAR|nr:velvet factor-domain-containing protein [Mycena maculata]